MLPGQDPGPARSVMTEFHERHHFPYTPEQLFDLVADVESYSDFVPGVLAAHIRRRDGGTLWVDMTVGNRLMRRRFVSTAVLRRPHHIDIVSSDPLFEGFKQVWTFQPAKPHGTSLTYRIEFRFRSRLLQAVMGAVFGNAASDIVHAFRRRARQVYGKA
jgi:coenzyme Q-binding protein COQ10